MWQKGDDPDNFAIPYLTAIGDLLGTAFLAIAFHVLYLIGDRDADVGDWKEPFMVYLFFFFFSTSAKHWILGENEIYIHTHANSYIHWSMSFQSLKMYEEGGNKKQKQKKMNKILYLCYVSLTKFHGIFNLKVMWAGATILTRWDQNTWWHPSSFKTEILWMNNNY